MASLTASITAAPSCAACVFGATATVKYSYTVHTVQTVNITVIPHVTTFSSAPNITSYETLTHTDTIYVGGDNATATGVANATTFNSPEEITWKVGNATLTYPTTYIRYLGFAGAAPSNAACAEDTNAKRIEMPQSTPLESFIYPYTEDDSKLPTALLDYLGTIPTITEQIDDANPATCAPLTVTPAPSVTVSNIGHKPRRYEGARRDVSPTQVVVDAGSNNSTHWLWQRQATGGTGTGTGLYPTQVTSETSLSLPATSIAFTSAPANEHTTAFVLNTITGAEIVIAGDNTAEPVSIPTQAPPDDGGDERPTSPGDEDNSPLQPSGANTPGPTGTDESSGKQTQDLGNLLDILPSVGATDPQDSPAPSQGNSNPSNDAPSPAPTVPNTTSDTQPTATQPPVFNVDSTLVSANSNSNFEFGTQELTLGQTVDIGSGASPTLAVIATDGGSTRLVIGGSTYQPIREGVSAATAAPAVITADGRTYVAAQSGGSVVFNGASTTFAIPAGSVTTVGGVQFSAAPDGSGVVVDGSTLAVPWASSSAGAVLTVGDQTFSAVQSDGSILLVDGTSTVEIDAGSQTVINGHTLTAGPSGNAIVVDGSTTPVTNAASTTPTEMVVTADGNSFTAVDESGSIILKDGSSTITLVDGSQTSFDGQTVSALPDGNGIVVDESITTRFGFTATSTGVSDYINGGLGSSPTSTGDGAGTTQTSENAARPRYVFTSAGSLAAFTIACILL